MLRQVGELSAHGQKFELNGAAAYKLQSPALGDAFVLEVGVIRPRDVLVGQRNVRKQLRTVKGSGAVHAVNAL